MFSSRFVSQRFASPYNAALFNAVDITKSYAFAPYLNFDFSVSSQGLKWFGQRETIFSLTARDLPGAADEPGNFGVDIPSLGPRLLLTVTQEI